MPEAHIPVEPFCLTLLRIAHAFSVAELGLNGFKPFLTEMSRERDLSNRAQVLGGGAGNERPGDVLHEVGFQVAKVQPPTIAVQIRLLSVLGTPTYSVAVGSSLA
jgi:hypothetical protein